MTDSDIPYVTALVKSAGTSFFYGMKVLEPQRRNAMYGVYAFCRVVDDIADEEGEFAAKQTALNEWRTRISDLYVGKTVDPITRVLSNAVRLYNLPAENFQAIINGMEMDAGPAIIAPLLEELDLYCDRVAAAVGRLSVLIFGDASASAQDVAFHLGRALQFTNILRDVGEDAARGRIYLPAEFLADSGIEPNPATILHHPNLPNVCTRIANMAGEHFTKAEAAMDACIPKAMRPARLMSASYKPMLEILIAQKFDYSRARVSLPKWRKMLLAAQLLVP